MKEVKKMNKRQIENYLDSHGPGDFLEAIGIEAIIDWFGKAELEQELESYDLTILTPEEIAAVNIKNCQ